LEPSPAGLPLELTPAGLPEVLARLAAELSEDSLRRLSDAARRDAARFEHLARECTGAGARGALAIEHERAYGLANRLVAATIFGPAPEATP